VTLLYSARVHAICELFVNVQRRI